MSMSTQTVFAAAVCTATPGIGNWSAVTKSKTILRHGGAGVHVNLYDVMIYITILTSIYLHIYIYIRTTITILPLIITTMLIIIMIIYNMIIVI